MTTPPFRAVIACGGTGGHLFPGLAVAETLKERGHEVLLFVSEKEIDTVALKGHPEFRFEKLPSVGMPSMLSPAFVRFLRRSYESLGYCRATYRKFRPSVVLGMGGFTATAPIIFTKVPECVVANGADIRYPAGVSDSLDYEAELAVIIGRGGRGISKADAYSHICGYTIINDVTARDLQGKHKQWFLAKSLDTFCPMGPWLVTADAVDPANLGVKCWVNDELRQNANTRDLIFDIPTLIETISAGLTLRPGDIIATGTPAGVGIGFSPPKFLQRGDRVTIEIEGLGRLLNKVA